MSASLLSAQYAWLEIVIASYLANIYFIKSAFDNGLKNNLPAQDADSGPPLSS